MKEEQGLSVAEPEDDRQCQHERSWSVRVGRVSLIKFLWSVKIKMDH
jgi:hypothetical protein